MKEKKRVRMSVSKRECKRAREEERERRKIRRKRYRKREQYTITRECCQKHAWKL